jgi:hypothetical protein
LPGGGFDSFLGFKVVPNDYDFFTVDREFVESIDINVDNEMEFPKIYKKISNQVIGFDGQKGYFFWKIGNNRVIFPADSYNSILQDGIISIVDLS